MQKPEDIVTAWWQRIDAQAWDSAAELLHPDALAEWPHTDERFDASSLVEVNRNYPGTWRVTVDDIIASGDRATSFVRVTDGSETYAAASFWTVREGLVVNLVELWADCGQTPPAGRR